ncbi:MAG: putative quinol monooxygenase [Cyclobacteriaceae bacterium]
MKTSLYFVFLLATMMVTHKQASAQPSTYMRKAKIEVDSTQLNEYIKALKAQMESALKNEKGVLAYSALQDKNAPWKITIVETYASVAAYEAHIKTAHFKKYKEAVDGMVTALELTDVVPIAIESKLKH